MKEDRKHTNSQLFDFLWYFGCDIKQGHQPGSLEMVKRRNDEKGTLQGHVWTRYLAISSCICFD